MIKHIFLLMVILSSQAHSEEIIYKDQILAKVNGKIITSYELDQMTQRAQRQIAETFSAEIANKRIAELKTSALDQFIDNVIILDEFKSRQHTVPKSYIDKELDKEIRQRAGGDSQRFITMLDRGGMSLEEYRDQISDSLAVELMVNEHVKRKVNITPIDITRYYQQNEQKFLTNAEVRGAIILITKEGKSEEQFNKKLEEITSAIASGVEFADVADKHTELPNSPKGGDMGFKKANELNEQVLKAIEPLSINEISAPIEVNGNVLIVKLYEKRGGTVLPLVDVRDRIKNLLEDEGERHYYKEFIAGLRKKASIENFDKK